jgi:lysozyme
LFAKHVLARQAAIEEARRIRYAAFGIEMPLDYSIHGIDVSYYQETIDWPSVAAMNIDSIRLQFAFMKATEGLNLVDKKFKRNWRMQKKQVSQEALIFFSCQPKAELHKQSFISRQHNLNLAICHRLLMLRIYTTCQS